MRRTPAAVARSISSIFAPVSSSARSFCSPSRGLTSTIPTTTPILPAPARPGPPAVSARAPSGSMSSDRTGVACAAPRVL
jgi:hypothetical protein